VGFGGEAFDGGIVAIGGDERGESFDEMPGGTVERRFVAWSERLCAGRGPLFAAGNKLSSSTTPFAPRVDSDFAIESLRHGA